MSVRRLFAGVSTAAVVAASLSLAAPALADPPAGYAPASSDVIGVGSDTTEFALNYLADGNAGVPGYNASNPTNRLVSWNALPPTGGTATINLPSNPTAPRPNGSGNGKKALYGAGNVPDVDFARSSSALDATEKSNGLQAFPFAKDSLALATAKISNAPATISAADMVKIYTGAVTNWSQIPGGSSGVIEPKIPQSGSGTRSFFNAQLLAANGGNAYSLAAGVVEVQEHDPAPIQNNPNAVAPFSIGRNAVGGDFLRIEGGFGADRALYNVVRQNDIPLKPELLAIFGDAGFVCSPAAKPLIAAAGFTQLLPKTQGGVCGVPTQDPTTNLATQQIATTATVAGTSAAAGALNLTATVASGSAVADGLVTFFLDGAASPTGTPVPLTGGKASKALTGVAAGAHTVVAKFTPGSNSVFLGSQSAPAAVSVLAATPPAPVAKASTKLAETFKASYAKGAVIKAKVKVKESATGAAAGKVVIKLGSKTVGKGAVKNGVAVIKLTKPLKKGKNKLVAKYAGNSAFAASKLKFVITIKG